MRKLTRTLLLVPALMVALGGAAFASDAEMEKTITAALVEKLGDDAKTIRVAFHDEKATLSGHVKDEVTQELAEEVALYVPGVKRVGNEITSGNETQVGSGKLVDEATEATLEGKVKEAVHDEIGQYSGDLEVEACGSAVSLRGHVPDVARRDLAITAAKKVKGVTRVIDLIRVP